MPLITGDIERVEQPSRRRGLHGGYGIDNKASSDARSTIFGYEPKPCRVKCMTRLQAGLWFIASSRRSDTANDVPAVTCQVMKRGVVGEVGGRLKGGLSFFL